MSDSFPEIEKQLLEITTTLLTELGSERALQVVNLDAELDRDLGIGSLEKTELFHRIEKTFGIRLPDSALVDTVTLRDLIAEISKANPSSHWLKREIVHNLEISKVKPTSAETLVDVLTQYAQQEPQRPHVYMQDENGQETIIRYGQLFDAANAIAKSLYDRGLRQGETVAIMLPTHETFFYTFFGILLAGGIPVPIYPPFRADQIEEYAKREAKILHNAEVRFLVTFQQAEALSKLLKAFIPSLVEVTTAEALMANKGSFPHPQLEAEDPALIQYTSGSTGDPKGVLLSHRNLLTNISVYGQAVKVAPHDIVVSWLPLYHDMGLIGSWLGSLYYGLPLILLSPLHFLSRPERWLWSIHYHRATISAGPNFAYELCARKIDDNDIEGLDLSSWRLAFNGAEAIYPKTLANFTKRFSRYGFKPETFFPVYGLAESSVALTFPPLNRLPVIDRISREPFEKERRAIPAQPNEKNYLEFVSCGTALPGHEVRIVNEKGEVLNERQVGVLQFKGPSAMQGYYRNQAATEAVYHNGWWDSGDFAYQVDGEVFITGRKKDVIIKAGRNLYPAEVEELATEVKGVRRGCVAAFGITDEKTGTEKFVVVAETHERDAPARSEIIKGINRVIFESLGIPPDHVVLANPGAIPKTSSGKLRRSECKQLYIEGKLTGGRTPFWLQITKLSLRGFWKKLGAWASAIGRFIYALYVAILLLITVPFLWLGVEILPYKGGAIVSKIWARVMLIFGGCPPRVQGYDNAKKFKPMVFVSNHASYVDTILLTAILPTGARFVAKQELLKVPILGRIIKKMRHITVDRMDFSKSEKDAQKIETVLAEGYSIVIFPEGTFTYATGLRPFKLGAFKVAAETNTPLCPVTLRGTRRLLRANNWLPKASLLKVTISEPITTIGNTWQDITHLRSVVRQEMGKYSGEPNLDLISAAPPSPQQ